MEVALNKKSKFAVFALAIAVALSLVPSVSTAADQSVAELWLTIKSDDQKLAIQYAGRPDGHPMVFRISGSVFSQVPGGGPAAPGLRQGAKLFNVEGYNIRKLVRNAEYLYLVTREILFYTDPNDMTKILTSWKNPIDGKTYPVIPIANDTVNSVYRVKNGILYGVPANVGLASQFEGAVGAPIKLADGTKVFASDISLNYALNDDGRYAIADPFGFASGYTSRPSDKFVGTLPRYTGIEAFDFWITRTGQSLALPKDRITGLTKVPRGPAAFYNSWARVSAMPPFTCIPESPTNIRAFFHARAWTLSSFDKVEPWLKTAVLAYDPQYKEPPLTAPVLPGASADRFIPAWKNQTSWSAFHAKVLKGQASDGTDLTWANWCSANGK